MASGVGFRQIDGIGFKQVEDDYGLVDSFDDLSDLEEKASAVATPGFTPVSSHKSEMEPLKLDRPISNLSSARSFSPISDDSITNITGIASSKLFELQEEYKNYAFLFKQFLLDQLVLKEDQLVMSLQELQQLKKEDLQQLYIYKLQKLESVFAKELQQLRAQDPQQLNDQDLQQLNEQALQRLYKGRLQELEELFVSDLQQLNDQDIQLLSKEDLQLKIIRLHIEKLRKLKELFISNLQQLSKQDFQQLSKENLQLKLIQLYTLELQQRIKELTMEDRQYLRQLISDSNRIMMSLQDQINEELLQVNPKLLQRQELKKLQQKLVGSEMVCFKELQDRILDSRNIKDYNQQKKQIEEALSKVNQKISLTEETFVVKLLQEIKEQLEKNLIKIKKLINTSLNEMLCKPIKQKGYLQQKKEIEAELMQIDMDILKEGLTPDEIEGLKKEREEWKKDFEKINKKIEEINEKLFPRDPKLLKRLESHRKANLELRKKEIEAELMQIDIGILKKGLTPDEIKELEKKNNRGKKNLLK